MRISCCVPMLIQQSGAMMALPSAAVDRIMQTCDSHISRTIQSKDQRVPARYSFLDMNFSSRLFAPDSLKSESGNTFPAFSSLYKRQRVTRNCTCHLEDVSAAVNISRRRALAATFGLSSFATALTDCGSKVSFAEPGPDFVEPEFFNTGSGVKVQELVQGNGRAAAIR
eukprot:jgi/Botrbrau1/2977/Bobra.0026s0041.1